MEQQLTQLQTEATQSKFDVLCEEIRLLKIEIQKLRSDMVDAITDRDIMIYERANDIDNSTPPGLSDTALPAKADVVAEISQAGTTNPEEGPMTIEQLSTDTTALIWQRNPEDVTAREYNSFYKKLSGITGVNDQEDPLAVKHISFYPVLAAKALLYVPKNFQDTAGHNHILLYVEQVLVTNQCRELLPNSLGFIHGVVDMAESSTDPPALLRQIQKNLVNQCLEMFAEIASKRPDLADAMHKVIEKEKGDDTTESHERAQPSDSQYENFEELKALRRAEKDRQEREEELQRQLAAIGSDSLQQRRALKAARKGRPMDHQVLGTELPSMPSPILAPD